MYKLLRAEWERMTKSAVFWVGILFMGGLGLLIIVTRYLDWKQHPELFAGKEIAYANADGVLFCGGMYMLLVAAVFVGIFVGTEYSDGTMRNKLIAGYNRLEIYLSKLLVCSAANVMFHLLMIMILYVFGTILLPKSQLSWEEVLLFSACSSLFVIALTGLYFIFSMLIQSKAVGSVTILVLGFILMMAAMTISSRLDAPEYYDAYTLINEETGKIEEQQTKQKNPHYLTGAKRKVYETLYDVVPSCQLHQIMIQKKERLGGACGYAVLLLIASVGVGCILFRRLDIR